MKFCGNCGNKMESNSMFCSNCGTKSNIAGSVETPQGLTADSAGTITTGPIGSHIETPAAAEPPIASPPIASHGTGPYHPPPLRTPPNYAEIVYHQSFLTSFLSSPSKAIKEGYVSPVVAVALLLLSPLAQFLSVYAASWRTVTDQAQMMIDNRWTTDSVTVIRSRVMEEFNWAAALGATFLHILIAFFIGFALIFLIIKIRGHNGAIETDQFFSLAAFITIIGTVYTAVTSLVMFASSSWGGFMAGIVTITMNGHTETLPPIPQISILFSAIHVVLLYMVVKRIFKCSTENAVIAISVASIASFTYQAFAVERIFYALYGL